MKIFISTVGKTHHEFLASLVAPGVATGDQVQTLFQFAKQQDFVYPAVNVAGSNSINATLEAAQKTGSPVIVQLSYNDSAFFIRQGLQLGTHKNSILSARYIHTVADAYGIPVVLHTDHAAKNLLP